jgi:hypothetical protein
MLTGVNVWYNGSNINKCSSGAETPCCVTGDLGADMISLS